MSHRLATDDDALAFVVRCIAETPDLYVRAVASPALATGLRDELGIDSIGLVALFYAVTDALGLDADESEAAGLETLGDVVAMARRLAARTS